MIAWPSASCCAVDVSSLFGRVLAAGNVQPHARAVLPDGLLGVLSARMIGHLVTGRDAGQVRAWFHVEREPIWALSFVRGGHRQGTRSGWPRLVWFWCRPARLGRKGRERGWFQRRWVWLRRCRHRRGLRLRGRRYRRGRGRVRGHRIRREGGRVWRQWGRRGRRQWRRLWRLRVRGDRRRLRRVRLWRLWHEGWLPVLKIGTRCRLRDPAEQDLGHKRHLADCLNEQARRRKMLPAS